MDQTVVGDTGRKTPERRDNRPYSGCNVILLWMAQAAGIARHGF